jgi:hypothetical protein
MKRTVLSLMLAAFFTGAFAQCIVLPTASTGSVSLQCASGTGNRSGVAYNPAYNVYYSVDAGSGSYPIETYSSTGGSPVFTVAASFDYRGLWWNPNTNQLVGNGNSSLGEVTHVLNGSGYATGVTNTVFTGMAQPSSQSCASYDYNANEIIGYGNNSIYRYNAASGVFLGAYAVTGLPVAYSNMDSTSLGYTGCTGMEICLYDHNNKAVYFINKATGAYVSTSQLPNTASGGDRFMFAFANNMAWVFDPSTLVWQSYVVFTPTGIMDNNPAASFLVYPNPASGSFSVKGMDNGSIEIFNALGERIFFSKVSEDEMQMRFAQPKGIYFWRAVDEKGGVGSGTLIIE